MSFTWKDRVAQPLDGAPDSDSYYDLIDIGGHVKAENVKLKLKNELVEPGTPVNAHNLKAIETRAASDASAKDSALESQLSGSIASTRTALQTNIDSAKTALQGNIDALRTETNQKFQTTPPLAHKASHAAGGSDAITPAAIGAPGLVSGKVPTSQLSYLPCPCQQLTTNYTVSAADSGKVLFTTATRTVTLPGDPGTTELMEIYLHKRSATASVTLTIASSGATIWYDTGSTTGSKKMTQTNAFAMAKYVGGNTWIVKGDIDL